MMSICLVNSVTLRNFGIKFVDITDEAGGGNMAQSVILLGFN